MPIRPNSPALKLIALVAVVTFAGCQPASTARPVPSVAQIGGGLKCTGSDHGFTEFTAGWGFCYPYSWKYNERSQASLSPPGLDLTFDITDVPCTTAPGASAPVCSPGAGLFAFMIISTYERGSATSLAAWEQSNMTPVPESQPISWGNAVEAQRLADGRRIALTQHYVVILDLHSGQGNLDLEAQMSIRLDTWRFSY